MYKYALKRLILAFVTAFIIISLTFLLMKMLPFSKPVGNDVTKLTYYLTQVNQGLVLDFNVATEGYGELLWYGTDTAYVNHYFYVRPIMDQYFAWIGNIFTEWNWGVSTYIAPNQDAMSYILAKLPNTIKVNVVAVIISVPIGISLGIWAALKKNTMTDHIISTVVMIFISIPSFIIITFLMLIFCYQNEILPSQWYSVQDPISTKVLSYIIPVSALSFGSICGYTRFTRAELTEVMSSDYLLLARTKGLTKSQTVVRHALRNAMVPIFPSILAEFVNVLSGSMILEKLYGIPGVGSLFISAIGASDYNLLLVDMAFYTIIGLTAGIILDLSYGFIDPRIRMGGKK